MVQLRAPAVLAPSGRSQFGAPAASGGRVSPLRPRMYGRASVSRLLPAALRMSVLGVVWVVSGGLQGSSSGACPSGACGRPCFGPIHRFRTRRRYDPLPMSIRDLHSDREWHSFPSGGETVGPRRASRPCALPTPCRQCSRRGARHPLLHIVAECTTSMSPRCNLTLAVGASLPANGENRSASFSQVSRGHAFAVSSSTFV